MTEPYVVRTSDGELLHEYEVDWEHSYGVVSDGEIRRDPHGWHFKDGKCDCSYDCCLEGEGGFGGPPYKDVCPGEGAA